jgi:hypothetical protein
MHPIASKTGNKRAMNSSPLEFCEMSVPEGLGSIALIQSERDEGGGSRVSRSHGEAEAIPSPLKNPATGACFVCLQFKSKGGNSSGERKISG